MKEPGEVALFVGELLIRSGLVAVEHLQDAVQVAEKMRIGLGRVLEMNGYLSESALDSAVKLQAMINSRQLDLEEGLRVLETIAKQELGLETALRQVCPERYGPLASKSSNKLGDLLAASGIINPHQFDKGIYNSLNTGLPLGMVLIQMEAVSLSQLESAIAALRMVRQGSLSRDQAVQALRAARLRGTTFEQSVHDHDFRTHGMKREFSVGDLLVAAGVITEAQLLASLELELVDGKQSLNDALNACGLASPLMVSACQHVLTLIKEGAIPQEQGIAVARKLRPCKSKDEMKVVFAMAASEVEPDEEVIEFAQLLQQCAFVSEEEIEEATPVALNNREPLVKTLCDAGVVDQATCHVTQECKQLIDHHILEIEQGIIALMYAVENRVPLSEAIERLGWSKSLSMELA